MAHAPVLVGLIVAAPAVALVTFERRDLRV